MNLFPALDGPFCVRLVATLAHFLWQALAVAALAALAALALRRSSAQARYVVYVAALALIATAPVVTFLCLAPAEKSAPSPTQVLAPAPIVPGLPRAAVAPPAPEPEPAPATTAPPPGPLAPKGTDWTRWTRFAPELAAAYFVGVTLMMLRLLIGLVGGGRLRRLSQPVEDHMMLAALSRTARTVGLTFTPAVAFCRDVAAPAVVGVLRPMLLLPLTFATGLAPAQVEAVLAHELAHVRRHDYLINVLQRIVESALFFHPAVWWVSRRIRVEREHCCDDAVLAAGADPRAYAESLVILAERRQSLRAAARLAQVAALGAAAERPSQLRLRILRLLGRTDGEPLRLARAWPVVLLLAATAVLSTSLVLQTRGEPAAAKPPLAMTVMAHRYYETGKPVWVRFEMKGTGWKPIPWRHDHEETTCFVRVNGKEHRSTDLAGYNLGGIAGGRADLASYLDDRLKFPAGTYRVAFVYENLDATDPVTPGAPVRCDRLATNEVEFEVVDRLPGDYIRSVYQPGWDATLKEKLEFAFADEAFKVANDPKSDKPRLLMACIGTVPFDLAFDVFAEPEGGERRRVGAFPLRANQVPDVQAFRDDRLTWENAKDRRWRLVFVPSAGVAMENPPITSYYGHEFATDWQAFAPSDSCNKTMERRKEFLAAKAAVPRKPFGVVSVALEFRIVPNAVGSNQLPALPPDGKRMKEMTDDLAKNGPEASRARGDEFQWFEVQAEKPGAPAVCEYQGRKYTLLCAKPPYVLTPDGPEPWGVKSASATKDEMGHPTILFQFDDAGKRLFGELTKANIGNSLAILVKGKIVSAPTVKTAITGGACIIVGNLTDAEAAALAEEIKAALPPAAEAPWGQAVEGVSARLAADKAQWKAGEAPTFKGEVRNEGKRELSVAQSQSLAEIEADGKWYRWVGDIDVKSSAFGPGRHYESIPFTLDRHWQSKEGAKALELAQGKHTVRVAFTTDSMEDVTGVAPEPIRVVSNAVEIEVLPAADAGRVRREAQLRLAMEALALAEGRFKAGQCDASEVQSAKLNIELIQAEIAGDPRVVANVRLAAAMTALASAEARFRKGLCERGDVEAAKFNVELMQAEIAGDPVRAATVRLAAAQAHLKDVDARFKAGLVDALALHTAQAEVEVREVELRDTRAAPAPAAPPKPAAPGAGQAP